MFLRKLKPTISYSGCFSVHLCLAYLQQSFLEIWHPWVLLTVAHQCRHQPAPMSSPGDWSCNQEGPEARGVSTGASSVAGALGKTGWNITLSSFLVYVIIWVIVNVIGNDETVRSPLMKKILMAVRDGDNTIKPYLLWYGETLSARHPLAVRHKGRALSRCKSHLTREIGQANYTGRGLLQLQVRDLESVVRHWLSSPLVFCIITLRGKKGRFNARSHLQKRCVLSTDNLRHNRKTERTNNIKMLPIFGFSCNCRSAVSHCFTVILKITLVNRKVCYLLLYNFF